MSKRSLARRSSGTSRSHGEFGDQVGVTILAGVDYVQLTEPEQSPAGAKTVADTFNWAEQAFARLAYPERCAVVSNLARVDIPPIAVAWGHSK